MNKYFEQTLPEGYKEVFVVDAEDRKTIIVLTIVGLIITLAGIAISWFAIPRTGLLYGGSRVFFFNLALCVGVVAYMVLHELTHGAAYKWLTKQKLSYGFSFTVAYCGVPNIFVYRKTALISLCAPLMVFTLLFGAGILFCTDSLWKLYFALMLSIHIGGCVGDLYDIYLFLFKMKDSAILMQDTGPKQTFYAVEK